MIDLSFLTEEEREVIMGVLERDAELKRSEESRITNLKKFVTDRTKLRYLTGEWFYETKSERHQDRIHGSDLIRASMKQIQKSGTISELAHKLTERPSFVSSENQNVHVPPELSGLIEEPNIKNSSEIKRDNNWNRHAKTQKPFQSLSSMKERQNPFNSESHPPIALDRALKKDDQSAKEPKEQTHTQGEDQSEHQSAETINMCNTQIHENITNSQNFKLDDKLFVTSEVRTLNLAALQKTSFKDTINTITSDLESSQLDQSCSKDKDGLILRKLSSGISCTHKEISGAKPPMGAEEFVQHARDLTNHVDISQTEKEDTHSTTDVHNDPLRESERSDCSSQQVMEQCQIEGCAAMSNQETISLMGSNPLFDVSAEDCTYRASPILIHEETDDFDSQVFLTTEKDLCPLPAHQSCSKETDNPVPPPWQFSKQENKFSKIDIKSECLQHNTVEERKKVTTSNAMHSGPYLKKTSLNLDEELSVCYYDLRPSESIGAIGGHDLQDTTFISIEQTTKRITEKDAVSHYSHQPKLRSSVSVGEMETGHQHYHLKTALTQQKTLSPAASPSRAKTPRSKDSSDDELRRSPSKTCHPKALPRESSCTKTEGSPLKMFPIDIAPTTKGRREQLDRPVPTARQRKVPSQESSQSGSLTADKENIICPQFSQLLVCKDQRMSSPCKVSTHNSPDSTHLLPQPIRKECAGEARVQQIVPTHSDALQNQISFVSGIAGQEPAKQDFDEQNLPDSSNNSGPFTGLVRSFIAQNYEHYLGSPENAHLPPFYQEKAIENINASFRAPLLERGPRQQGPISDCEEPPSCLADSSPVALALERLSSKPMSPYKSLESLRLETACFKMTSTPVQDQPRKRKTLIPLIQLGELESDCTSDDNVDLTWRTDTGSSKSNISITSGMTSMSSVSGSVSSVYFGDFGDIEVQGTIQFAVNYIQEIEELQIFVGHCRDLAVAEPRKNRSDPYVKCYLLPDKTKMGKRKTSIQKKTLNPTYNEILRYIISMEVLRTKTLNVSVWHKDYFGRNSFLGEVELDLCEWNFDKSHINEYALGPRISCSQVPSPYSTSVSPCAESVDKLGQMRVALRFLPQTSHSAQPFNKETGEVQIWVKDCKNLPPVKGVVINPFVKCTVLPDTSRKSRQKTRVVKRTANPLFNHTMVYNGFRPDDLREACVEITVWDHDGLFNRCIGGLRLGLGAGKSYGADVSWMDSTPDEAHLWERMMKSPSEWVEDILPLRVFLVVRGKFKDVKMLHK